MNSQTNRSHRTDVVGATKAPTDTTSLQELLSDGPRHPFVLVMAAAMALALARPGDPNDSLEVMLMRKVRKYVLGAFTALGVEFDIGMRPVMHEMALESGVAALLHADASQLAFETLNSSYHLLESEESFALDELVLSAFYKAFDAGAQMTVTIRGRDVDAEVHAIDCSTGACLGRVDA
jgi:hypothetical protein